MTPTLQRSNAIASAGTLIVLPVCFAASGFAGIVYQIAVAAKVLLGL